MSMEAKFTNANAFMEFMTAGRAHFTLRSLKTGNRLTFKVSKARTGQRWFVNVLTGPDNTRCYEYLGVYEAEGFRTTAATVYSGNTSALSVIRWALERLAKGIMPADLEVWHEGRCGRCGRLLTVPESIATGFGPECSGRVRPSSGARAGKVGREARERVERAKAEATTITAEDVEDRMHRIAAEAEQRSEQFGFMSDPDYQQGLRTDIRVLSNDELPPAFQYPAIYSNPQPDAFRQWCAANRVYYYARPKDEFYVSEAYSLAADSGCSKLILENMS